MCSVRFSQTVIISLYNIHLFVFLKEAHFLLCEVRTESGMYCKLSVAFNVFTKYFFPVAVSPVHNGESLHRQLATISLKDRRTNLMCSMSVHYILQKH
jgi:hypothetical protein